LNDASASIYKQQCAPTPIISVLDPVVDHCSAGTTCRLPLQNWMRVRDAVLALGASGGPKGGFVFADPLTAMACSAPFDLVVPFRNPARPLRAGPSARGGGRARSAARALLGSRGDPRSRPPTLRSRPPTL